MDLTSGTPLWPTVEGLPAVYPRLHDDVRCDVAVIGGGITGALVSHRFALQGISTVVLEADELAHGSTAATTALIQYEIDTHLVDLIDRVGHDHAVRSYRLCLEAVRGIGDLAAAPGDDCAWRSTRSLYLASRRRDAPVLERERLARRSAGIEVELLQEHDIRDRFSFRGPAALLSPVAGELDAYRLTHKLLAEAKTAGLRVYDRTRVTKYSSARTASSSVRTAGFASAPGGPSSPRGTRRRSSSTGRSFACTAPSRSRPHRSSASKAGARTVASSGRPRAPTSTPARPATVVR
jgi:glycine/D-amino acid oxidase-like deaminating enzyme